MSRPGFGALLYPDTPPGRTALASLVAGLVLVLPLPAPAHPDVDTTGSNLRPGARAEDGGPRAWLDRRGVSLELTYTGETWFVLRGGLSQGSGYRGSIELSLAVDLEKLGIGRGGRLLVRGENGHGHGISERRVGDLQTISSLEAHEFTQLSEVWLEQRLLEDRLRLKIGKQDANADFCVSDYAGDFVHASFGLIPTVPMPTFPHPALGAALFGTPAPWLSLGVGIYDGDADGRRSGFSSAFDGRGGAFAVAEATLRPGWTRGDLPGRFRTGVWHHSADLERSGDPDANAHSGNYGVYAVFDQRLLARAGSGGERGLGLFGQLGWAPADRNEITRYFGAGISYRGLLSGRPEDVVGLGVAHAQLSRSFPPEARGGKETAIELFYRADVTSRLSLQPDLQLVLHPAGEGGSALVAGVRFELRL